MAQFLQHPTDCTLSCMTFPGMCFRGITRETKHAQMGADSPRSCYPQGNCCGICGRTFGKPTLNYSQFVFPATPELILVSEVYRASVIFENLESQCAHIYWTLPSSAFSPADHGPNHRPVWWEHSDISGTSEMRQRKQLSKHITPAQPHTLCSH